MEKIPQGRYTKEFREEAVKLITEEGLSVPEASRHLDLPKSTIINWLKAVKAGKLGEIGKHQLHHRRYRTRREAIREIPEYIEVFYNRQRSQKRPGYLSPAAYERLYHKNQRAT